MGTILLLGATGFAITMAILLIRRNLGQRARARHFRQIFVTAADDLIGKAELPDAHARQLLLLVGAPLGIGTRIMVLLTLFRALTGKRVLADSKGDSSLERVPQQLLEKYVRAILAFIISDSYHSAFFGPIFRAGNGWIFDAIREVKPDVRAHATKHIVASVVRAENVRVFRRTPEFVNAC